MKALLFIAPVVGAISVIAVGCSTAAPTPPDSPVPEFCSDWAKAYCQLSAVCQFDADECATNQTTACNQFADTALASGTRSYNQPNGAACITLLNSTFGANSQSLAVSSLLQVNIACESAFIGNVQQNQPCTSTYDCASGTNVVCAPFVGGSGSVCGTVTDKTLGQACGDPGDTCQGGSYCAPSTTSGPPTCVATPVLNGTCSAALPCGQGNYCTGAGVCAQQLPTGAACTASSECASSYCDQYPPAACVTELTFARGSDDCNGILNGPTTTTQTPADAGVGGSTVVDSGGNTDSGGATDGPTGG